VNRWRFALSRRWLGYLALVVVFAIACYALGTWQLARRAEAHAAALRIENNYDSAPVPVADLLPTRDSFEASQEWRPVTLSGRYLVDEQLLVRTRPLAGTAGFEVLTPLQLDDGSVFIVDRGWVPAGREQDDPDHVPAAPAGAVEVVARLKPGEPTIPGRSAPEGQIASIQLDEIADRIGAPTHTGAYGLLVRETPPAAERPQPLPRPVEDEGPHLSYAFQWFVFALLGFVGLSWAIRQEYRAINSEDPQERERAAERERRRQRRAPSDADVEDAILDGRQARETSSA
jgi:cytochrome oxidase assembly protein ShyY1